MFNLTDSLDYWLYSEPTDMRKSFYTLSGIVSNIMNRDPLNGAAYIFINKGLNRMKILRMEYGGFVLYSKILEVGRFHRPQVDSDGNIQWRDLVLMVEGIVKSETRRAKRLDTLKDRKNLITDA